MTAERTSIRSVVETVFYSGPAFSAGRLLTANGAIVKFAGKVFVRESDPVRLEGHWVDHPKYGRQFEAEIHGARPGDGPGWPVELSGQPS